MIYMQYRMKTHPLSDDKINLLLERVKTCCLATLNADGTPYCTPIHFAYLDGAVYFHGLPKGKKLENIARDPRVSVTVYEMEGLLMDLDKNPCDTNTKYESVILSGTARKVEDVGAKRTVLERIVNKYTPDITNKIPENMINSTVVIRVDVKEISGKFYA